MFLAATLEQAIVAAIVGFPTLAGAWFMYGRSQRADSLGFRIAEAELETARTTELIGGLNLLIAALQADNTSFRAEVRVLAENLTQTTLSLAEARLEIASLKAELLITRPKPTES